MKVKLVLLSLISSLAFGKAPVPASATQQKLQTPGTPSWRITVAPALLIMGQDEDVGYGANFEISTRVGTSPVYIGLQSGFGLYSDGMPAVTGGTGNGPIIPILVSILYRVESPGSFARPFFGIATGPTLLLDPAKTAVTFEALARLGVELEVQKNFAITLEPRVGILGTEFLFAPQVGFTLSF